MVLLLADIGGTNARFCLYEKGKLSPIVVYLCDDFKTPYVLIDKVVSRISKRITGMVIAGAGPVKNNILTWTNRPGWKIATTELKKRYTLKNVLLVNDVQAQGEGLKTLYKCSKTSILMTAGTGLGSSFIMGGQVMPGEVGQIQTHEGLKVEEFVSGPGIVRLYHSFGGNKRLHSAHKIEELRDQNDRIAEKAWTTFYQEWGKIAARMVTAVYATGGVYLWGGLIPKTVSDKQNFQMSYLQTLPKMLQKIPFKLVKDKSLTFKGLMTLSRREFGQSSK